MEIKNTKDQPISLLPIVLRHGRNYLSFWFRPAKIETGKPDRNF